MRAQEKESASEKGKDAFLAVGQKLTYAGKILNDDAAVKEDKTDEKNFVVVMVMNPKAVRQQHQPLSSQVLLPRPQLFLHSSDYDSGPNPLHCFGSHSHTLHPSHQHR